MTETSSSFSLARLPAEAGEALADLAERAREPLQEQAEALAKLVGADAAAARRTAGDFAFGVRDASRDTGRWLERRVQDLVDAWEGPSTGTPPEARGAQPAMWRPEHLEEARATDSEVARSMRGGISAAVDRVADQDEARREREARRANEELRTLARAAREGAEDVPLRAVSERRAWDPGAGGP